MEQLFSIDNLLTLGLLTLLQAVLGFDNLLYISLLSKHAPAGQQAAVRRWGIGIAMVFRIVLLLALIKLIQFFQNPVFSIRLGGMVDGTFTLHSLISLAGGAFILYTATKEIAHMMGVEDLEHEPTKKRSLGMLIAWIVLMNLVFSFDSILTAMALTKVFWVMAAAIVIGGLLMIWLSDRVAAFLERNRTYEVLGLFILFIVGIMLLTEGGHLAHLHLFGQKITAMSKVTFYFVISVLVLVDIVQSRYHKRLMSRKIA